MIQLHSQPLKPIAEDVNSKLMYLSHIVVCLHLFPLLSLLYKNKWIKSFKKSYANNLACDTFILVPPLL